MVLEFWIFDTAFLISLFAFITVALSLNLEAGYTGVPNFGKALFVFLGAWGVAGLGVRITALLIQALDPSFANQAAEAMGKETLYNAAVDLVRNRIAVKAYISPYLAEHIGTAILVMIVLIIVVAVIGAIFGVIASYAAVRLKEDYLAILLLAFSEATVSVVFEQNYTLNGGTLGFWAVTFSKDPLTLSLAMTLALAIIAFIYAEKLGNSPMGRAMRAVRDDEVAAEVYGRDVAKIRLKVIVVASILAALAGFTFAEGIGYVKANNFSRVVWTFLPWSMIILGGMANNKGTILGVVTLLIGMRLINMYSPTFAKLIGLEPGIAQGVLPNIFLGVLIILILYIRPQGIIPEGPSKTVDFEKILKEVPAE